MSLWHSKYITHCSGSLYTEHYCCSWKGEEHYYLPSQMEEPYFKWPEPHHLERGKKPCLLTNTFLMSSCSIATNIVVKGKASLKSSRIHLPWVIECKPWLCKHFQEKVIIYGINFHSWLNNTCWPSELGENSICLVRDWPDW